MELNLKCDSFQQIKVKHQHYYLNCTWEETPEFEFEGSRYKIDFQLAEDNGAPIKWIRLDLYPTAQRICGGKSVNGRFFNALKNTVDEKVGKVITLEAVPVRCGDTERTGAVQIGEEWRDTYDLEGLRITAPVSLMQIQFRLKEPFDVFDGNRKNSFNYEEKLKFAVTKIN